MLRKVKIKTKNKTTVARSIQNKSPIIGDWRTHNYLDMDKGDRRKFIPNPLKEGRFDNTSLPQIKV